MNERIKELEKLATPRCYDETGCYIGNRFDVEKFAQLIIQRCCEISDKVERADLPVVASKFVKAHFGVE